jgi:hypothetical protein
MDAARGWYLKDRNIIRAKHDSFARMMFQVKESLTQKAYFRPTIAVVAL